MTREEYLSFTYPLSDGTTYIQALDVWMSKLATESKETSICPKCSNQLDKDGLCWRCLTDSNK
jgi:predicted amidophosphoribosyltransferase